MVSDGFMKEWRNIFRVQVSRRLYRYIMRIIYYIVQEVDAMELSLSPDFEIG